MTRLVSSSRFAAVAALAVSALAACSDNNDPPQPATIAAISDANLSGTVGELLATPLEVRVTDAGGSPVGGTVVTFTVAEGGGSVTAAVDTTDNGGRASTTWRLGERVVAQRVTASVAGVTTVANFVATARAGAAATIAVNGGDNQSAAAGAIVGTAPSVIIRDRFTNPVSGVSVFFSVASGGGTISGAGATTNAAGVATAGDWRLGGAVGMNRLTALAVSGGVAGNPITFTATATAGAAASIAATNTTAITGTVGALVTPVPGVRVLDANGNPVAGASVTFASSAGGSVVGATKTTDAAGLAAPDGWQLGTLAQTYTLTASIGSLTPVVFTANARPGAPSAVSISAGNNQSAVVGRTLPVDPAVRVADAFNNPIAGVEVLYEVISGGGTALVRRPVTNAAGIATVGAWTLGDEVGANSLRATVQATGITGNPVLFTATATPGTPTSMLASAGTNQTATVGNTVPTAPAVILRDIRGNPVAGIAVTFLIGTGGGTVTGATAVTSAAGIATVGSWTLGATAGTQTLIARAANLPDVTFTATATAGAASVLTAQSLTNLGTLVVAQNQAAPSLPSVRVTDAAGNPIAGVTVTFTVGNGSSGTITGTEIVTGANGIATLGSWTLPTIAGIASVIAEVPGLTGVTFTATMNAGAPTTIVNAGTSTLGVANTQVPINLRLQDQFGNNVTLAGVSLSLSVTAGAIVSTPITTNGLGIASTFWNLGAANVAHTLTVTGTNLTQFQLTLTF